MTALAANQNVEAQPRGRNVYDLAAATQVWAGGLVGANAAGLLVPWDDTAANQFIGLCLENALEPTKDVAPVNDEGFIVKNVPVASAVQASVQAEVFCTTDNVLTDLVVAGVATSRGIGRIIRFRTASDCDVEIYSAAEWAAGRQVLDPIASLTDSSGGTGSDTLAAIDVAMVAVGGSGMSTAQEAEYNATMTVVRNAIASLAAKVNAILAS